MRVPTLASSASTSKVRLLIAMQSQFTSDGRNTAHHTHESKEQTVAHAPVGTPGAAITAQQPGCPPHHSPSSSSTAAGTTLPPAPLRCGNAPGRCRVSTTAARLVQQLRLLLRRRPCGGAGVFDRHHQPRPWRHLSTAACVLGGIFVRVLHPHRRSSHSTSSSQHHAAARNACCPSCLLTAGPVAAAAPPPPPPSLWERWSLQR